MNLYLESTYLMAKQWWCQTTAAPRSHGRSPKPSLIKTWKTIENTMMMFMMRRMAIKLVPPFLVMRRMPRGLKTTPYLIGKYSKALGGRKQKANKNIPILVVNNIKLYYVRCTRANSSPNGQPLLGTSLGRESQGGKAEILLVFLRRKNPRWSVPVCSSKFVDVIVSPLFLLLGAPWTAIKKPPQLVRRT